MLVIAGPTPPAPQAYPDPSDKTGKGLAFDVKVEEIFEGEGGGAPAGVAA